MTLLTSEFLTFSLVFIVINFVFGLLTKKFIHLDGVDFLFFAPWLAGIRFGVYEGLILAAVIMIVHSFMHMRIARLILLSFPAVAVTVVMGYYFGLGGFWITLVVYYFVSSVITALLGGLGGGYFMFLLANSITNIVAFFVYQFLL